MKIAIIGTGNVGSALAKGFVAAGHKVLLGVRNKEEFKGSALLNVKNISVHLISEAASTAEVILIAAVPQAIKDIAAQLDDVSNKVIIDAMNSVHAKPERFTNTTEDLLQLTNCKDVVKCFNTTGAENISNPVYNGAGIDRQS